MRVSVLVAPLLRSSTNLNAVLAVTTSNASGKFSGLSTAGATVALGYVCEVDLVPTTPKRLR